MCGGYVYKSKLKGRRSLCIAALFPQNDAFTKVNLPGFVGLIDEISIQRIHIEEKIRGHDLSHLVVLIVLMTVDASCRLFLLFLSGSWKESMLWRTLR